MSAPQLLSLVGTLFALLVALVGVIFNSLRERIKTLEARDNSAVILTRLDAATQAHGKLEGRFEQWTKDKVEFDYHWRHEQYVSDINSINGCLLPLSQQAKDFEKRVTRLESKVFNGHGVPR